MITVGSSENRSASSGARCSRISSEVCSSSLISGTPTSTRFSETFTPTLEKPSPAHPQWHPDSPKGSRIPQRPSRLQQSQAKVKPPAIGPAQRRRQQHCQPITEKDPRDQSPEIAAFVGSAQLEEAIGHQREQQHSGHRRRRMGRPAGSQSRQDPRQLPGTTGTDGKRGPIAKAKGAVWPAVAAEDDGQPPPGPAPQLNRHTTGLSRCPPPPRSRTAAHRRSRTPGRRCPPP